jgi:hypothetical protein
MVYLSRQGVEYRISGLMRRFSARNRTALVSRLYTDGIFAVGSWPPKVLARFVARR